MEFITNFFTQALYRPLFNLLILIYEYIPGHDFGLAIIILTFSLRSLFYPITKKSLKSQKALNKIQPKVKKIQKKYKDNKEKQMEKIMELYKKREVNPFGGCLPLLIQLPILIALYRVFWHGFQPEQLSLLYNFIPNPGQIDPMFLNWLNLSNPNMIIAGIAAVSQFAQTKMMMGKKQKGDDGNGFAAIFKKQMIFLFPIFTFVILTKLPAAIGIYWLTSILFSVGQQYLISKDKSNKLEKEDKKVKGEEESEEKEDKKESNKDKNKKNESRKN